jgi:hypothetical protein
MFIFWRFLYIFVQFVHHIGLQICNIAFISRFMRSLMLLSSELDVVWWIVISLRSVKSPMSECLPSNSSALSSTLGSPWSANVISLFVMKLRA